MGLADGGHRAEWRNRKDREVGPFGCAALDYTLSLIVVMGIVLYLSLRKITAPLISLREATLLVSEGIYDFKVPSEGNTELAQVGATFNFMTGKIKEQIGSLSNINRTQKQLIGSLAHELKTMNMDDGLLDAKAEMVNFLNMIAAEPDIAKVHVAATALTSQNLCSAIRFVHKERMTDMLHVSTNLMAATAMGKEIQSFQEIQTGNIGQLHVKEEQVGL